MTMTITFHEWATVITLDTVQSNKQLLPIIIEPVQHFSCKKNSKGTINHMPYSIKECVPILKVEIGFV